MSSRRSIPGLAATGLMIGLTLTVALFCAPAAMAQDTTPPTLVSATVNGATVTMTFNEEMDPDFVPPGSAFRAHIFDWVANIRDHFVDGSDAHPVEISGKVVRFTVPVRATERAGVNVRYWRRGRGPQLRDLSGNELEHTPFMYADNLADTTAPVPYRAETAGYGREIYVYFHEGGPTWHPSSGAPGAFTVTVDGVPAAVAGVWWRFAHWILVLGLSQPIPHGEAVTVSYTRPSSNPLADSNGNSVASFGPLAVHNAGPPSPRLYRRPVVHGTKLWLTYDRRLDGTSTPAPGDFRVEMGDDARGVTHVAINGFTVTLTLASAEPVIDPVSVSYTKGVNPIRDGDGNEAGNIVDHWVQRIRGAPQQPPAPVGGEVEARVSGRSLTMTFETELDPESRPSGQAFTVTATPEGGSPRSISGTDRARIAGRSVMVPLASAVAVGESVSVNYARGNAGHALRAADGHKVVDFSNVAVANATGVSPAVTQVEMASDAGEDGTYALGETVRMRLTFDTAVDVAGTPRLKLGLGPADGDERWAVYESGAGTAQLSFAYAVAEGDASAGGVALLADTLEFDGGTIAAAAGGAGAALSHAGLGADPDHRVDGIRPRVAEAAIDGKELTVTFDEELAPAMQAPERTALLYRFFVKGTGVEQSPVRVEVDGRVVTLRLGMAAEAGQKITVSYNPGRGGDRLRDAAGNLVAAFTDTPVTNAPASGAAPLTASFVGMPGGHDGKTAFGFELRFSENFPGRLDYKVLKDHALQVTNGRAIGVRRAAPNQNQRWTITVRPWSSEEVAVSLAATADCSASAAVCTPDGRALSNSLSATVSGPGEDQPAANTPATGAPTIAGTAQVGETLTASTTGIADADGLTGATFAWQWLSNEVAIAGATGASYTLADADVGRTIKVRVTFTDDAGHVETLTSAATAAVAPRPLTASFVGVPAEHDGWTAFSFELRFSEDFPGRLPYKVLKDHALQVTNGRAVGVKRAAPHQNQSWTITVRPWSVEDVTVTLPAAVDCAAPGSVCTETGRKLANTVTARVLGPPLVSVADAEAREGVDQAAAFAVTLNRAASGTVTVDYATVDGTAVAGEDYTATSGTLTFAVGEREQTVAVAVLDDEHDEGPETFRLRLSNANGAHIADGEAVGTILNADEMPKAWLARFGRTVAEQVLAGVEARLAAPRAAGSHARVAGQALGGSDEAAAARLEAEALARWLAGTETEVDGARAPSGPRVLAGSAFALTAAAAQDDGSAPGAGSAALWGRGGWSRFDGNEDGLSVDGEVLSATLGADYATGRWLAGAMLAHARGSGSYDGEAGAGTVESTLTGVFPYAGVDLSERLTAWAALGLGLGGLTLTPEGALALETDLTLLLGALGARGRLVEPAGGSGFLLAIETDAYWTRTSSGAVPGLAEAEADATRLRLGLEGGYRLALDAGGALEPTFEVGVRHDGGDAETGYGMDLGGGLAWADPSLGLSARVSARGLLTWESGGFRDVGLSGSLAWDPDPSSDRGPSLTVTQTLGSSASGGMQALLGHATLAGLAATDDALGRRRLELRAGYGYAAGDRFTAIPEVGLALEPEQREYRVGWRLVLAEGGPTAFELALEGTRREHATAAAEHGIGVRMTGRW